MKDALEILVSGCVIGAFIIGAIMIIEVVTDQFFKDDNNGMDDE